MKTKVLKFGGSSLSSKQTIDNCKNIIMQNSVSQIIVVSAFGKNNITDQKLTDLLIDCVKANLSKNNFDEEFDAVKNKIKNICNDLKININIKKELKKIKKQYILSNDADFLISRGEYLTAKILSKYYKIPFIDAKNIMFFSEYKPNYIKIKNILQKILKINKKIIVPGFYGTNNNNVFIFSRGGSDVSGAIIAKAYGVKIYENFTDVCGVKPINPKVCDTPLTIKKISYNDMQTMASFDANVLHPDCCKILQHTNVKTYILNSCKPNDAKTIVQKNTKKIFYVCFACQGQKSIVYVKGKNKNLVKIVDCLKSYNVTFPEFCDNHLSILCNKKQKQIIMKKCFLNIL